MSSKGPLAHYRTTIHQLLSEPHSKASLYEALVDIPFRDKLLTTSLDLGIIVLLFADKKTNAINRIALSKTEHADWAVKMSPTPFHEIIIPLDHKSNIIAQAIKTDKPQSTSDWKYLFEPALQPEAARFNQAGAGIACSFVYALHDNNDGGAMIFSFYQPLEQISATHRKFMSEYSQLVSEALDLG